MNRSMLLWFALAAAAATLGAQEEEQANSYRGTSNPPSDEIVVATPEKPIAKPAAGRPMQRATQAQSSQIVEPRPASALPTSNFSDQNGDDGIVQVASEPSAQVPSQPALNHREQTYDPDGDIVHPVQLGPGQLGEGTVIRARLLDRLSTAEAVSGQRFRTRVAVDVMQGGQVLIPAGSEVNGHIYRVSSGSFNAGGSMYLRPETVTLPDGSRYKLSALVTDAHGTKARVGTEGTIDAGSRMKRNSIEYGGAMGAGAVTGALWAGPAGALAGTLIGAGVITVHLMVNHSQAVLENGTLLQFTLTQQLNLAPVASNGN